MIEQSPDNRFADHCVMPGIRITSILLATDFSPASMAAVPYAVAMARHFTSKLYLAHVISDSDYSNVPLGERDPAIENAKAHAEEQMAGLRGIRLLAGIPHEVLIDHGGVWPTLSAMVEKHAVDLLVIGTQGRRGIEKLVLGSTAEEILRMAQQPVLIVGPKSSIPPETEAQLRRILYATDFSPESELALHYASALAQEYGASLALLHVAEDVWREPLSTRLSAAGFFQERFLERGWALPREDLAVEYYVEFGPRADSIVDVATKLQIQLIVLGVRGVRHPQVVSHLPGPTAYDVVSRAQCPVLVLRGEPLDQS